MASMKVRKKSRMSTRGGGAQGWDGASMFGVPKRKKHDKRWYRRREAEDQALREQEALEQEANVGLNWTRVMIGLNEGLTLEQAKEQARM